MSRRTHTHLWSHIFSLGGWPSKHDMYLLKKTPKLGRWWTLWEPHPWATQEERLAYLGMLTQKAFCSTKDPKSQWWIHIATCDHSHLHRWVLFGCCCFALLFRHPIVQRNMCFHRGKIKNWTSWRSWVTVAHLKLDQLQESWLLRKVHPGTKLMWLCQHVYFPCLNWVDYELDILCFKTTNHHQPVDQTWPFPLQNNGKALANWMPCCCCPSCTGSRRQQLWPKKRPKKPNNWPMSCRR